MDQKKYTIGGKTYVFSLTLEQDELLAPIVQEMLKECPDALQGATEKLVELGGGATAVSDAQKALVSISLDMMRVNAWVYAKKYARRILAILLVPLGKDFEEADVPEREKEMAKHATREVAAEVINSFFMRSGAFAVGSQASSAMAGETERTP